MSCHDQQGEAARSSGPVSWPGKLPGAPTRWWLVLLVCWLGLVYLPDIGRGFLKDDFRWIAEGRIASFADLSRIVSGNLGFYRPLVTLTFSANHALFGLHSYPYALTNLAGLVLCVWAIRRLALALGLAGTAATVACALWALNFHGIGGSLLWISGRTSLLLTLFSVLAVTSWVRGQPLSAAAWLAAAVFSKEDAVVVPIVMALWSTLRGRFSEVLSRGAVALLPLAIYVAARQASGAFSYWNAPPYYTPTADLGVVGTNVLQYLDRNATLSLATLALLCLAARTLPALDRDRRRLVVFGVAWAAVCQAPTLFLEARSSLYVLLPSVGIAIAAAAMAQTVWERQSPRFRRNLLVAGTVLVVASWPVYHARNLRLVRQAELSAATIAALGRLGDRATGRAIVLRDDPNARDNFASAFGALLPDVHRLVVPQAAGLRIEPAVQTGPAAEPPRSDRPALEIVLNGGVVRCCGTAVD